MKHNQLIRSAIEFRIEIKDSLQKELVELLFDKFRMTYRRYRYYTLKQNTYERH